jgi:hypothetical protein
VRGEPAFGAEAVVGAARLTPRQPLELFELPMVFSQAPLLPAEAFRRELERRGLWPLHLGQLEELHRTGTLRPLLRLVRDVRAAKAEARRLGESPLNFLLFTPTTGWQIRPWAEAGELRQAGSEPFRPWHSFRRTLGDFPFRSSEFLYSRYQLLISAGRVRQIVRRMRTRRDISDQIRYRLPRPPGEEGAPHAGHDPLVVVLSALEARYLPSVVGRVSLGEGGSEGRDRFERAFDPVALLAWLRTTPEAIVDAAERLLSAAEFIDPLGDWWDVIRFGRRDRWERLKHEALLALDHRISAEMLLRFHEDLAAHGVTRPIGAPPRRSYHPRHGRIPRGDAGLEAAVTEFGLSSHPTLALIIEGETEAELIPRALDAFLPPWRSRVRWVNARGVDANLDLLAAYASQLSLGEERADIVVLARPYTRMLVVFDPEGSFATEAQREVKRKRWAARIQETLPEPHRSSPFVLQQVLDLVEVDTWGAPFEFAHFKDGEIARAAYRVARRVNPAAPRIPAGSVAQLRKHGGDLEKLWRRSHYRGVTKPAVASELWPILERRLHEAADAGDITTVPLGRVLARVSELAFLPRHGWALQTRERS